MSRYLLCVWPYSGHVHPNIALGKALQGRGHQAAFYTGALADAVVTGEGFTRFPFRRTAAGIAHLVGNGTDRPAGDEDCPQLYEDLTVHYTAVFDQGPLAQAGLIKAMYRDWFAGTIPHQVGDLTEILADWQPDAVVCDPFMWGPTAVLREIRSTPVAVFSYFAGCLLPGTDAPPFGLGLPSPRRWWSKLASQAAYGLRGVTMAGVRREVNRIRDQFGLPPLTVGAVEYAGRSPLYLVASVPEYDFQRRDLPASVRYVGPFLWDRPSAEPSPAWLTELVQACTARDTPIVYVSEGSAHTREPVLLRAAAAGLADLPLQVLMTTGRHRRPEALRLGPLAANIRVEQWAPHSDLFPAASAVVTNGGSGTVLQALLAGLPLVIVPMQWDHLENAQRVAEAGAGLRIAPRRCTPERVRAAVRRILEEPSFRAQAQALGATLRQRQNTDTAASLLEQLSAKLAT